MPHIDIGGVEKNFFLYQIFFSRKQKEIIVITISKKSKNLLNKNIKFITLNLNIWNKMSKRLKFILALFLLVKELFKNKNPLVISFQANIYCGLLSKLLGFKLIIRSNTSPYGWSKNFIKQFFYKIGLRAAKKVIVNSIEFKKIN